MKNEKRAWLPAWHYICKSSLYFFLYHDLLHRITYPGFTFIIRI